MNRYKQIGWTDDRHTWCLKCKPNSTIPPQPMLNNHRLAYAGRRCDWCRKMLRRKDTTE